MSRSFVSVRDTSSSPNLCSFEHCLTSGYADDGGMFLPYKLPNINDENIDWSELSHQQTLANILSLLISSEEIGLNELSIISNQCYQNFNENGQSLRLQHFDRPFDGFNNKLCSILELWHGPTLTFKDIALAPLAALLQHFTKKQYKNENSLLNIVVGTSGDTGSAAIEAVKSLNNIHITVLYPSNNRISLIQEYQMIGVNSPNVTVIGVDGSSDDLDIPIKEIFDDLKFKSTYNLCSINSINIVRILCQCAHIIYTINQMKLINNNKLISLSVPSGAIGHLVAVIMCKRMGLEIDRICVACNLNGIISDFIQTGIYRPSKSCQRTESCAIDIGAPYNIERLIYLIQPTFHSHQQKASRVCEAIKEIELLGEFHCNQNEKNEMLALGLYSYTVNDNETLSMIQSIYSSHNYLIDPHTAVGMVAVKRKLVDNDNSIVCLSTAHPAKFIDSLIKATNLNADYWNNLFTNSEYKNVRNLFQLVENINQNKISIKRNIWTSDENWTNKLKETIIEQSTKRINKE